ncbi:MAG: hypothetical protein ABIN99_09500, partial [Nitrosospira sp.]
MIEKICLRQGLGWHGCDSTSKPEIEKQSQFKLDIQTVLFKYLDISIGRFHIKTNFYVCSSHLIAHPLEGFIEYISGNRDILLGYSASARNSVRWAGFVFKSPSMAEV